MSMPIYLMFIGVFLSVEFCFTLKTYLKGAPFYNASAWETCGRLGRHVVLLIVAHPRSPRTPFSGPRHVCFRFGEHSKEVSHNTSTAAALENLPRIATVETLQRLAFVISTRGV